MLPARLCRPFGTEDDRDGLRPAIGRRTGQRGPRDVLDVPARAGHVAMQWNRGVGFGPGGDDGETHGGGDLRSCGAAPAMASSSCNRDRAKTGMRPQFSKEPRRADVVGFFHSEAESRESTGKAAVMFSSAP